MFMLSDNTGWRDIDQTSNRGAGRLEAITDLFHELRKLKKTDLWERSMSFAFVLLIDLLIGSCLFSVAYTGDAALKKKKHSTATLKSLFSSNVKFQRNLKRYCC